MEIATYALITNVTNKRFTLIDKPTVYSFTVTATELPILLTWLFETTEYKYCTNLLQRLGFRLHYELKGKDMVMTDETRTDLKDNLFDKIREQTMKDPFLRYQQSTFLFADKDYKPNDSPDIMILANTDNAIRDLLRIPYLNKNVNLMRIEAVDNKLAIINE